MKPKFHITQNSTLIDTKVEIRITDLLPNEIVTLKAEMRDNLGVDWESCAEFTSDNEGKINLATAQPLSGTYDMPDITGLFWSMSPIRNAQPKNRTPLKPLETKIFLMRMKGGVTSTSIIREVVSPEVYRLPISVKGLVGTFFFHPKSGPLPTVIVLGGSEGGLRESNAALLASHGFNTLALAYFGTENQPKKLVCIPLDYMEKL
ncbi:acyl-CoA thioesterase/BAAT N-terminal domain-containing protein [Sporosarcina sp. Te-1]|uniref:acyl-CoA thioesterase/BAAT N-terminal domain-containing protein n=1 Tax=Sporosarcina sp. Te-1 TaxID=2818390 RepID=UPI001A9F70EE|nr:acyl-CoA thioesterase/BAAT N-terminal domain-containing protein [Sporosarcina sp. Te-1]QTD42050.1 acyl-CoA thioesterase/BAAT N-terminal domain-containing protein [Sporosarcina sp. Te-1]